MRRSALFQVFLVVILFLLSSNFHALYYTNQNTYFPQGLRLSGETSLRNDWYSNTTPAHALFTILVIAVNKAGVLSQAAQVVELSLAVCLVLALWLQVLVILTDLKVRSSISLLAANIIGLFVIVWSFREFWENVTFGLSRPFLDLNGLAGQYVYDGYLQPSEFGILIILGIVLLQTKKFKTAFALFGFSALIHFSYFIHTSVLASIGLLWLFRSGQTGLAVKSATIYVLFAIPAVAYALSLTLNQPDAARAATILAYERIPHHALPRHWINLTEIPRFAILVLSTIVLIKFNRGILKWVFEISFTYVVLGIVIVVITGNSSLALLFPWRASVYLVPLGTIVLVTYGVVFMLKLTHRPQPWRVFQFAVYSGLLLAIALHSQSHWDHHDKTPYAGIIRMVREETSENEVLLVPPDWEQFRLEAMRPIFVDWKSHPYAATEVLEWWRRVNIARDFYAADTISDTQVRDACTTTSVSTVLVPADKSRLSKHPIASAEGFLLFRCASR